MLASLIIVGVVVATGLIVLDRYEREVGSARQELRTLSFLLSEETSRSLQGVHLVLKSVIEQVVSKGVETPADYEREARDFETHQLLRAKIAGIPQLDAVTMISNTGRLINFSRSWPIPPVNVADRDYFAALSNETTDAPFVSEPVENRGTGTWTIYLAMRINGPRGEFLGLVLGAMQVGHLENVYGALQLGEGSSITLWRRDGVLLARYPPIPLGQRLSAAAVTRNGVDGVYESSIGLEGVPAVERLIATRQLATYPLFVNVARTKAEVLEPWRRDVTYILGAGLLCIVSVALVAWATMRQFLHFEALVRVTSERERAVLAREQTERQLRQVQKLEAIGQLTAGIAHDFNNLLTVVLGGTEIAQRMAKGDPRLEGVLKNMSLAAERGATLTGHLLSFARKQPLRAEVIDVSKHVTAVVQLLRRSVRADVAVDASVPDGIWHAEVDQGQLELALLNIGLNARDAMPDGGTIHLVAENRRLDGGGGTLAGDFVAISVIDSGEGIPPEIRDRIFEPFFTTKEVGKGSGLGLSQAYGFATQSGGTIEVDSTPGKGTRITLLLPARQRPERTALPANFASSNTGTSAGRLLLVEDDTAVAEMVSDALREVGYDVFVAYDGVSALQMLDGDGAFDLVFSDVTMPGGMNGIELAQRIRKTHPRLPILLTTGYSDSLGDAYAQDFPLIRKPYDLGDLRRWIDDSMAGRTRANV